MTSHRTTLDLFARQRAAQLHGTRASASWSGRITASFWAVLVRAVDEGAPWTRSSDDVRARLIEADGRERDLGGSGFAVDPAVDLVRAAMIEAEDARIDAFKNRDVSGG